MAYGKSNGHVTGDFTGHVKVKVKVMSTIRLGSSKCILKTAGNAM